MGLLSRTVKALPYTRAIRGILRSRVAIARYPPPSVSDRECRRTGRALGEPYVAEASPNETDLEAMAFDALSVGGGG